MNIMIQMRCLVLFLLIAGSLRAQVTCLPVFPTVQDDVTIFYDATAGNGALAGVGPVYAHMGLITDKSQTPNDWKYVVTTWAVANAASAMTQEAPNLWKKTINIASFFQVPPGEQVLKLAFVFRNANGSIVGRAADGSDMFYDVYPVNGPLKTRFVRPAESFLSLSSGQMLSIEGAASKPANLTLLDNGTLVASGSGLSLATSLTAAPGLHAIKLYAESAGEQDSAVFQYLVPGPQPIQDPPPGTELGIQYLSDTAVRLSLYAPLKQSVYVLGDFNDWQLNPDFQMKRNIAANLWWIEIDGLQPGQTYRFQYAVDGIRIADPLSTLVLDPGNDAFIPPLTFPNVPAYPTGRTNGIVSVLQTAQPAFEWTATGYQRPAKEHLVIYELLLRDFIARHDYKTLIDTLDYLQRLGVNAIELMPVNEFGGNQSWGYNPSFHKAVDKYYGTADDLRRLVDACHQRQMAVLLDVVYNHTTDESPHARLYWDAANNRPAANNPWLNPTPRHDFNVFNDYNHESPATRAYVKNTLAYLVREFRIDGFRFDLSKGFTQKLTIGNVGAWGQYDASRIAILKEYADFIWDIDPDNIVTLEHFADNSEEKELAEYGMLLWGNAWGGYKEAALGYAFGSNTSMNAVDYKKRNWSAPHLIGYMESHDEERIIYECKTFGNATNPDHNVRLLPVALRRKEALQHLLYTIPGPKLMWQFGELGYDFPINYCPNGTINNSCRVDPKPIRWDYLQDPSRRRLYEVTAALLNLRQQLPVFRTGDYTANIASGPLRTVNLHHAPTSQRAFVMVNLNTVPATTFQSLPATGWWYEYYTGDSLFVGSTAPVPFQLGAADYRIYTNIKLPAPSIGTSLSAPSMPDGPIEGVAVYPNPAVDQAWVDMHLRRPARIAMTVVDAAGRVVYRSDRGMLEAGDYRMALPVGDWSPGIYFIQLDSGDARVMRKLVR
jgi:pullulanase/glycogen debranching enzyme